MTTPRQGEDRLPPVPALVDTTIRLLGQEPLAGVMPTAEQLRLAEILDSAGFAYLEVSGGGCFDSAVKRGVESPWERIRALRARTKTPLALALRGRFLVGSRPVGGDFVRRFVASAAESGIDVFRLHDPLNDVSNLREASEAITAAEREFDAGLVYSPGPAGETDALVEQARRLPELGAARVLLHDPSGSLEPHRVRRARRGDPRGERASGRPVLPGRRRHRARGRDRGRAGRGRPDRLRGLPGRARPPPGLGRGDRRRARRARPRHRRRHRRALAGIRPGRRAHQRPAGDAARPADRHAGRAAQPARRPDRRARPPPARARRGRPARRGDRRADQDPRRGRLAAARRADRPGARLAGAPARPLAPSATRPSSTSFATCSPGAYGTPPGEISPDRAACGRARLGRCAAGVRAAGPRRPARAVRRPRRQRGGAAPPRALRRGGGAAPPDDPRPRPGRVARGRRCRRAARRADPRDRAHRPGVGRRRGDDRGRRTSASPSAARAKRPRARRPSRRVPWSRRS